MKPRRQYAALPFIHLDERVEICLITSRTTGRWIIPKGWPQDGLAPHELAAVEAYEEAGLKGTTGTKSVGRFRYCKRLVDGSGIACDVRVYPLQVTYQTLDWPERDQRTIRWVKLKRAKRLVDDDGLSKILAAFDPIALPSR